MPLPVLRNFQFQLAYPSYQSARVIATPIAYSVWRPLTLSRAYGLVHLGLENLLDHFLHCGFQKIFFLFEQLFPIQSFSLNLGSGHRFISFGSKLSANNFSEIPWPFPLSGPFCRTSET